MYSCFDTRQVVHFGIPTTKPVVHNNILWTYIKQTLRTFSDIMRKEDEDDVEENKPENRGFLIAWTSSGDISQKITLNLELTGMCEYDYGLCFLTQKGAHTLSCTRKSDLKVCLDRQPF